MRTATCVMVSLLIATAAAGAPADNAIAPRPSRVRPMASRLAGTLRTAYERSPTFRRLVDRLQGSDVIVHLVLQQRLHAGVDGTLTFVAEASGQRYLRIAIRPTLGWRATIAMLAHELQHANEVAAAPFVRNEDEMGAFFQQIGQLQATDRFETGAACRIAVTVLRELDDGGADYRLPIR